MKCSHCGQSLPPDSRFCERCGAVVMSNPQQGIQANPDAEEAYERATRLVSPGVTLGQDGVMRWVHELNMWKNPSLVITIWKVLLLASMVPALLVAALRLVDGDGLAAALVSLLQVSGLVAAIVTALMLFAYPLVAVLNGGRYCVIFEMDKLGISHIHMQRQFRRNQVLAMLTAMAGALAGSPQAAGAGLLAGSRRSLYTAFSDVRAIEPIARRSVIHLATRMTRNQVYAAPEDFDFVLRHIASRCRPAASRHLPNPSA